ncbi:MAG: D-sedoheptulose 7-phosphate isomerase [Candidatus Omnitrophica bacterium]|nr:D-sedoheptulose 7-phosphate isomerase [Candidatus Omnitrophota bacterium]
MEEIIKNSIGRHKEALRVLENQADVIKNIASIFISSLKNKGKIIFCGNGGSCADAQHLTAELVGRFKKDRSAFAALALSTNTSILTAVANDYDFKNVFSRQIEALANSEDVLVGISTSGNSENILKAVIEAKRKKIKTIGFLGREIGKLKNLVDIALCVEIDDTPRIQEIHILAGHIICEIVEEAFTI